MVTCIDPGVRFWVWVPPLARVPHNQKKKKEKKISGESLYLSLNVVENLKLL